MKITTRLGTRLRLEPDISSLIVKTYYQDGIELTQILKSSHEDGMWYYVTDGEKKGWVRFDFIKTEKL